MKLEMMAIYDSASRAFLPPFTVASEEIALRQFKVLAQEQPKHDFVRFGHQYTLYRVGAFDNETGKITVSNPDALGTLQALVNLGDLPLSAKE